MGNWFASTPESEALLAEERTILSATEMVHDAMNIKGWNRTELAKHLGIGKSEISQRLNGSRNLTLRSLAQMLHTMGYRAEIKLAPAAPPVSQNSVVIRQVQRDYGAARSSYRPQKHKPTDLWADAFTQFVGAAPSGVPVRDLVSCRESA